MRSVQPLGAPFLRNSDRLIPAARYGLLIFCAAMLALSGCSLMETGPETGKATLQLPPLVAPRDSIQLEILFVDRPVTDPLLGSALWSEVDEIGGLAVEQRARMKQLGWRIGHVSTHPPRALEELLQLTSDRMEVVDASRRLIGRRIAVPAGSEFPIEITDEPQEMRMKLAPDEPEKAWSDARGVLRVRLERQQDGWVKLNLLPEIHHGKAWLRPVATAFDWTRQSQQDIVPLYDQQLTISLNIGEMALLTADGPGIGMVGQRFFRSLDQDGRLQRLLILRVADMRRMQPVYRD